MRANLLKENVFDHRKAKLCAIAVQDLLIMTVISARCEKTNLSSRKKKYK